jgi:hypothetical protein
VLLHWRVLDIFHHLVVDKKKKEDNVSEVDSAFIIRSMKPPRLVHYLELIRGQRLAPSYGLIRLFHTFTWRQKKSSLPKHCFNPKKRRWEMSNTWGMCQFRTAMFSKCVGRTWCMAHLATADSLECSSLSCFRWAPRFSERFEISPLQHGICSRKRNQDC